VSTGSNSIGKYIVGKQPVITALFLNAAGTAVNPTTVTFITVDPLGVQTTTASPNVAITNPTVGTWVYTWPGSVGVTTVGVYTWRVKGVGALIDADEGSFEVIPSLVPTP
jgi:hypothetical protein